jgi:hypothetical protein
VGVRLGLISQFDRAIYWIYLTTDSCFGLPDVQQSLLWRLFGATQTPRHAGRGGATVAHVVAESNPPSAPESCSTTAGEFCTNTLVSVGRHIKGLHPVGPVVWHGASVDPQATEEPDVGTLAAANRADIGPLSASQAHAAASGHAGAAADGGGRVPHGTDRQDVCRVLQLQVLSRHAVQALRVHGQARCSGGG